MSRQITNDLNETQLNAIMGYLDRGVIKADEVIITQNKR